MLNREKKEKIQLNRLDFLKLIIFFLFFLCLTLAIRVQWVGSASPYDVRNLVQKGRSLPYPMTSNLFVRGSTLYSILEDTVNIRIFSPIHMSKVDQRGC